MNLIMDNHFDNKELISVNFKKINDDDTVELIVTKDETPKLLMNNSIILLRVFLISLFFSLITWQLA